MAEDSFEERTEEATQQRREEWRREGRVLQSREVVASVLLLAGLGAIYGAAQMSLGSLWTLFEESLGEAATQAGSRDWSPQLVMSMAGFACKAMLLVAGPLCLAAFVAVLASTVVQTGVVWTTKPLEMDPDKINPLNGFSRMFSVDSLVEMFKALIKLLVVGSVVYLFLHNRIKEAGNLWGFEVPGLTVYLGRQLMSGLFSVALAMFIVAVIDYGYQRFRYEQKIRMTKQEVKEERRQMDGNPQIKARIRGMQRRMAQNKMVEAVKRADVVVTNPTHIAVALLYDRENMLAPKIVAKGADFMAERIKKVARENGIPCVENVPLARAMYKALKIGQYISRDLYNAVAEVLAYVYKLKGRNE